MQNSSSPSPVLSAMILVDPAVKIAVVDQSGVFSCRYHSTVVLRAHLSREELTVDSLVAEVLLFVHR
jgi:hypothetical protein